MLSKEELYLFEDRHVQLTANLYALQATLAQIISKQASGTDFDFARNCISEATASYYDQMMAPILAQRICDEGSPE